MGVKLGTLDISAFKVGSDDCKVYLGYTLLYSGGTTPPTPSYKWLATYSGETTSSAECDNSSAITQNEISLTNLVSVEIGGCVTSIGKFAFNGCSSLTSIDIPNSVTSIGERAFYNCSGLTSIIIPNSVTTIDINTFRYCRGLTSCTIGSGVTNIGGDAFRNCTGLTGVTVEATTPPTLGSRVFDSTNNCPMIHINQQVAGALMHQGFKQYQTVKEI